MSSDSMERSPLERALPETHLAVIASDLELEKFIRKPKTRRDKYFLLIQQTYGSLKEALGYSPPDLDLREVVVVALAHDRTFLAFASNNGGADRMSTKEGGNDVVQAGAGAILCEYLKVKGEGKL